MNSLISINNKFMSISPKDLVNMITTSRYTKGIEIYITNNEEELKYLNDLVYEIKRNNLILQIHGNVELDFDEQLKFMKKLEDYSTYLEYPIVVTFHTIYDEDMDVSNNKTVEYLSKLINSIDNDRVVVCLENLNTIRGFVRLGKEDIRKSILNDENLYFTYDIGHEIANYGDVTNLDNYMVEVIRNVHIHSYDLRGYDHMPIYKNDLYWDLIMKGLTFLKINDYKYNVVFEYGIEYCYGDTLEEKINDYLKSIDYVSERMN